MTETVTPLAVPDWIPVSAVGLGWVDNDLPAPQAQLFAAWCGRSVLPLFERDHPDDMRPRTAIETREKIQFGLTAAAAWDAASDAARTAAWDAASDAASDAAWAAAWAAARTAASDAASDAAWDAAMSAAWDAASDAASDAAWSAARNAASDAAWSAARASQQRVLSLFVPPANTAVSETVTGLVRGWIDNWFETWTDSVPHRLLTADALQEAGYEYDWRIRALQELEQLEQWRPGMWPMTPEVVR